MKKKPLIVIFGRTNVGKSTLFNCLTEKNHALVSNIEGTTRDSNHGFFEWRGFGFDLVDTGGIEKIKIRPRHFGGIEKSTKITDENDIDGKVKMQVLEYLKKADLILFLTDNKVGVMPQDRAIAKLIATEYKIKTILIANKVDSKKQERGTPEFLKLGLGDAFPISATTGSGTGDLLDIIVKKCRKDKLLKAMPKPKKKDEETESSNPQSLPRRQAGAINNQQSEIKVCILGKPNVGKSSLLNAILGYDRVIVSPIAHTTREPQDTTIEFENRAIKLIDTAGISKHARKEDMLVRGGVDKTLSTLKRANIALLVIDLQSGLTHQDAKLVQEIMERRISFIIVANKWDVVEDRDTKRYTKHIYDELPFATWAPIHFVSALTGEKVSKILDTVVKVAESRKIEISRSTLAKFLGGIVKKHKPAKAKGVKHPRIYEIYQSKVNPPKFDLRIGSKDTLHFSYIRFIQNQLRAKYGFIGTPIHIEVIKNRNIHGKHEIENYY